MGFVQYDDVPVFFREQFFLCRQQAVCDKYNIVLTGIDYCVLAIHGLAQDDGVELWSESVQFVLPVDEYRSRHDDERWTMSGA